MYNKAPLVEENNNKEDLYNISKDELSLLIILKTARTRITSDKTIISQYNNDDLDELSPNYKVTKSSKLLDLSLNII
jgi:hypothetical protein